MKPLHLFTICSVTLLTACGGGGGGTSTTEVPYPDVTTTQPDITFTEGQLLWVDKIQRINDVLPTLSTETLSGQYTYEGVARIAEVDRSSCLSSGLDTCTYYGNADVAVNFDTSKYAGKIYSVSDEVVNYDGELNLKGSVTADGSLTGILSGALTDPTLNTTKAVNDSNIIGTLYDSSSNGDAEGAALAVVGQQTTIGGQQATFSLVAEGL